MRIQVHKIDFSLTKLTGTSNFFMTETLFAGEVGEEISLSMSEMDSNQINFNAT